MTAHARQKTMVPLMYNFRDWEGFFTEVMAYHRATRPEQRRVIDFVKTFRQFMSGDVLRHLNVLMNPHPRFDTVNGWDDWLNNVVAMLHEYDPTLGRFYDVEIHMPGLRIGCSNAAEYDEWNALLQSWRDLDSRVVKGQVTTRDQRARFWNDASPHQRQILVDTCEYIDPENGIWRYGTKEERKLAAQHACYGIANIASHLTISRSRQMKFWKRLFFVTVFLTVSLWVMAIAARAAHACESRLPFVFGSVALILSFLAGSRYFKFRAELRTSALVHRERTFLKF